MNRTLTALALITLALQAPARAETLIYSTGFEAPAYQTGPIGGGYYSVPRHTGATGWTASSVPAYSADASPWALVTDLKAAGGNQSLKLSIDPTLNYSTGVSRSLAPAGINLSAVAPERFGISLRLYLDQSVDSDIGWSIGLADSYANLVGITLTASGQVMYGHRSMNTAAFFNPGFDPRNTWLDLTMERNPADATSVLLTLAGRGQTWQQVVSSPGGGASVFYVGAVWPTFPLYRAATAYVDDVRIGYNLAPAAAVPESGAAAMLLAGLAGLTAWRRRRLA